MDLALVNCAPVNASVRTPLFYVSIGSQACAGVRQVAHSLSGFLNVVINIQC